MNLTQSLADRKKAAQATYREILNRPEPLPDDGGRLAEALQVLGLNELFVQSDQRVIYEYKTMLGIHERLKGDAEQAQQAADGARAKVTEAERQIAVSGGEQQQRLANINSAKRIFDYVQNLYFAKRRQIELSNGQLAAFRSQYSRVL